MYKILFIDTFATGLDAERCAIYRIGGVVCNADATAMREKVRFEFNVRPTAGARISDNSLWIGGVSKSDLLRYARQEDAFDRLLELLDAEVNVRNPKDKMFVAGFNAAAFDVPFLKNWFRINGRQNYRDYFYVQTIDLMSIAAFALAGERKGMTDFCLGSAARALGVGDGHSGGTSPLENALLAMDIYRALVGRLNSGDIESVERTDEVIRL